ncbi:DUF262 domain-containing protein [Vibrio parahaemolyticus]|uniref:DUF262 domain-containing protein n=1 Tax=Vibrio parahaemolyticus TaxID=670 RepID=UPI0004198C94|nr:DUF262 domain-containing protein [Vibrio parahaemolyticus]
MSTQIKPSVTNPTIADVYQMIDQGKLILQPDFQRKFVWTHEHQEQFIDTILKGYPFPEVYVCEGDVDIVKMKTTRNVIDGQQRLTTIKNYVDGTFESPLTQIPSYEQLSKEQKTAFVSYQIVMRDLGDVDDVTTREIFRRINLTKFKLDNIEIQNAIYDGEFIQAAKTILSNVKLEKYGVLKESEFTRMADLHFMLLVMSTVENGGYFAQDKLVENMVAKFNDSYPNREHMISSLIKAFAIIADLDIEPDSMWFRKSNFFTMVVEIAKHQSKISNNLAQLREYMLALEENVMASKRDSSSPYYQYYSYMYQGTHSRSARVVRSEFLVSECISRV